MPSLEYDTDDDTESSLDPELAERYRVDDGDGDDAAADSRVVSRPLVALRAGTALSLLGLTVAFGVLATPFAVDSLVVTTVGVVAVVFGAEWALRQFGGTVDGADPPRVELPATDVPGAEVDDLLRATSEREEASGPRTAVRRRLRRLVDLSLQHTGVPAEDAAARIDEESWTDDGTAASFFTIGGRGRLARLRNRFRSDFGRRARHVIDASADLLGLTDREWADPAERGADRARSGGRTTDLPTGHRATNRFRLIGGLVLIAVGLGLALRTPTLLVVGAAGTGLLAHRYASGVPEPELTVERRVDATDPDHGEDVTVTVTVENAGDRTLFDLRLIDGVPPVLAVTDGSPRHYTGLRPGASVTFSYDVEAERGCHTFDPLAAVVRSASGAIERTVTAGAEGDERLTCQPRPTPDAGAPGSPQTDRSIGSVVTDTGGTGIEFHSVREYRDGDPLKRIDWRRLARGGDLATLQFNVERSTTLVLVVDTRAAAFVASGPDAPSAVQRSVRAAGSVAAAHLGSIDRVGLATVGPDLCWVPPRGSGQQWPLLRDALTTDEAFTYPDTEAHFSVVTALHRLRTRLPRDAQLLFFTPLTDDAGLRIARRLRARGYRVTVVSPRVTGTDSPGRTVAHLERRLRLSRLRDVGATVVDWGAEPLPAAFERAERRWSR